MIGEQLRKCLDDLAERIDLGQEQANTSAWVDFLEGKVKDGIFCPPLRNPAPANVDWPEININDAFEDPEAMVLSEFKMVSDVLANSSGSRLNVRCNYGTGIVPSMFGCKIFMMDRELNTLPTGLPLHEKKKVQAVITSIRIPGILIQAMNCFLK